MTVFFPNHTIWSLCLLIAILPLSGCVMQPVQTSTNNHIPKVRQISAEAPFPLSTQQQSMIVALKAAIVRLDRGEKFGKLYAGPQCRLVGDMKWRTGRAVNFASDELIAIFDEELKNAGLRTQRGSNDIFRTNDAEIDYYIGASVSDLEANLCKPGSYQNDDETIRGSLYIKVNWEVYSPLERRVIAKFTTEGSDDLGQRTVTSSQILLENAFSVAIRNLLANEAYIKLLVTPDDVDEKVDFQPIGIPPKPLHSTKLQNRLSQLRANTVTVRTKTGHGSGFFISRDGYLLTNYHVVGNSSNVKLRLENGETLNGKVIRSLKGLDVALIKVDLNGFTASPFPMQMNYAPVGSDVYVIGSPVSERYSATVSKGILSAYRMIKEHRLIQSDATVHSGSSGGPLLDDRGNVIGITRAKAMSDGEVLEGLNLFIPINDAITSLNILLTDKPLPVIKKPAREEPRTVERLGQLVVKTNPPKATITIVGSDMIYFPGILLKPGEYRINVSQDGYQSQTKLVSIKPGNNQLVFEIKRNQITCDHCFGIPSCPYQDNGDGTVTDTRNNLMWMRCSLGQEWNGSQCTGKPERYNHPGSYYTGKYPSSHYAGYGDWRLPTMMELQSTTQEHCKSPAANREVFPQTPSEVYYTQTSNSSCHYFPAFNMDSGNEITQYCYYPAYIRMVRQQ